MRVPRDQLDSAEKILDTSDDVPMRGGPEITDAESPKAGSTIFGIAR